MIKVALFFLMLFALVPSHAKAQNPSDSIYLCPPCGAECDTQIYHAPGVCPHCGMALIKSVKGEPLDTRPQMTICFYLQDGVEILDFAGPMEVFSYAGFKVITVSKSKKPIRTQGLLTILPDYSIKDAPPYDILALFGGNASKAYNDSAVMNWIGARTPTTQYFFSVCTGAFILASTGLLDGHAATTFHLSIESLKEKFPRVNVLSNVRFVDNGRLITTAGISAGIDGALHLVAKLKGDAWAARVAQMIEYDKWKPNEGHIAANGK